MADLIWLILGLALPAGRAKNRVLSLRRTWRVDPKAEVHRVVLWRVGSLALGPGARIGSLTVLRDMKEVRLDENARLGQLNWVSSAPDLWLAPNSGRLHINTEASVTNRHYLDCSGGISIGHHALVAGVHSTFITHGIDWRTSEQTVDGIRIGPYCQVSSTVAFTPGVNLPEASVIGMHATVDKRLGGAPRSLALSPRAAVVKTGLTGAFFERESGFVKPPPKTQF